MKEKTVNLTLPWIIYQWKEGNQLQKSRWIVHSSYTNRDAADTNLKFLKKWTSNIKFQLLHNPKYQVSR